MLAAVDDAILERAEREEVSNPSVPVFDSTHQHPHLIYLSRGCPLNIMEAIGSTILTDFG
jgi:hypothetical protein